MKLKSKMQKIYSAMCDFKYPKTWAWLFFIIPIFVFINYFVFFSISAQETLAWGYDYPENGLSLGMKLFITGIAILGTISVLSFLISYSTFKTGAVIPRMTARFPRLFIKFIMLVLIAGGGTLSYFNTTLFRYTYHNTGPYLTWDNNQDPGDAITVCWHSALPSASAVLYGTSPDNMELSASSDEDSRYHKIALEGLTANTRYYYKVLNQDFGVKSFLTGPTSDTRDAEFSFIMYADPRTNNGINAIENPDDPYQENLPDYIMDRTISDGTDIAFSLIAGDIVGRGVAYDSWWLWLQDITTKDFASNHSHVVAIGNHEHYNDPEIRNMRSYYPQTEYTYSITYGQVYILMLDLYDYENEEWKDVQFPQDVKDEAAADLAAHSDYPFKIMAVHQSPINYGDFTTEGHHSNISEVVFDLCQTYDVDFYFCGHSHHYEVWNYTDTVYMMAGIGGNTNRGTWTYKGWSTDVTNNGGTHIDSGEWESGWIQVDVTETEMNIGTYLTNGTIATSITIDKDF